MIQHGFMVLQSNRLENLRRVTVEWLRLNPLPPLQNEVILVQSSGVAQWLKLALANDDDGSSDAGCGIAAALSIDLPGRFHWQAYRAVLGDLPPLSPFDKPLLVWRLLHLLPSLLDDPQFSALRHFLQRDDSQRKRYQLAERLADLLDQYQIYRADWLNNWAEGKDQISQHNRITALPDSQRWQAQLWRRLLDDIPDIQRDSGRAQIHARFLKACESGSLAMPHQLPQRVIVFGLSSLPAQTLEVLAAVSRHTQVILCVQNPCQFYWGDIIEPQTVMRLFHKPYRRHNARPDFPQLPADDQSDIDPGIIDELFSRGNPLLAAWGKQGRDYIRLLDEHDERAAYEEVFANRKLAVDLFEAPDENSRLRRLQGDIYHLRSRSEIQQQATLPSDDRSISFHIAHSRQREVEILQDHLLALFAEDPQLHPRDILVMVPDINQFAPHIQAVFGRLSRDDPRYIPFTVSDRGQRQRAGAFRALDVLMNLHRSRFAVSEILDLLDIPVVQEAFGLKSEDHALLHRWITGSGVRWGMDAKQRLEQSWLMTDDVRSANQNTWQFGLQRMLLGYTSGDQSAWSGIESYAEVGGLDAALAGIVAHVVERLNHYRELFMTPAPVREWTTRISAMMQEFLKADSEQDLLLITRVEQKLQQWQEHCELADFNDGLPIEIVSDYFLDAMDQSDLNQRFLGGSVNFATLMPMRAIPFRHICLLGMNDGDYPRQVPAVDFDLMRQDYRPGDRSRREDDRYLFLEALLSARDSLYIGWTGRSIRDNSERPPSVLVAQLREYLADTCDIDALTSVYPLQPFSLSYFTAGSPYQTFAHEWQPAQLTATGDSPDSASVIGTATGPASEEVSVVSLRQLAGLLKNPAAVFFEHVLGIVFRSPGADIDDDEVFTVDAMQRWQLQDQLLSMATDVMRRDPDRDSGDALQHALQRLKGRGLLPLGHFADIYHDSLTEPLSKSLEVYRDLCSSHPQTLQDSIDLEQDDGAAALSDTLTGIRRSDTGQRLRIELISGQLWQGKKSGGRQALVKWHYLARIWPAHLAAQLAGPTPTHILGPDTNEVLPAMTAAEARAALLQLLSAWHDNLQTPLASSVKTGCSWLANDNGESPSKATLACYEGDYHRSGEVADSEALARLWPDFDSLCINGFEQDSTALYSPLVAFWQASRSQRFSQGSERADQEAVE
ncbi:MAG TPA: exodeoxyribonuclease V subunit gamma [Pseudohongiella sp.]|nr:exodeoxyribonuclease V subunit gamma [Pseudohongiella sp.]|tara:strand:+ start:13490 stop:17029 length:3540 start_codon:yes stop_codon:yes gene_type:complete